MSASLELALAKRLVSSYVDESEQWKTDHHHAMECWACQEWLQRGIDAFHWLQRAEEVFTQAEFHGIYEMSTADRDAIESLYVAWLAPCDPTEEWVATLAGRGYCPENLNEFRSLCERARRIVADRCEVPGSEPASCADLALEGFVVTARDAEAAATLVSRKQARYVGPLSNHGIVEE